ncbi:MAG TPA: hypothetical protein PK037_09370, partial [Saprospiraceae bacterium]|nr:hypothetical protein [Saprospiraceae bacterium]
MNQYIQFMKSFIARIYMVLALAVCSVSNLFGATYYSQGSVTPSTTTNWNTNRAGGGSSPSGFNIANDVFVIQNGHNMTTSAAWSISGSNSKLQIESGGTLTATFAVTIASNGTFQIDNGGTYIHNNTGAGSSTIFAGTESFASNSLVELRNYQNGVAIPASIVFGNLTINLINYTGS